MALQPGHPDDAQPFAFCAHCSLDLYTQQPTIIIGCWIDDCPSRHPRTGACRPEASCIFDSAQHVGCSIISHISEEQI